MNEKNMIYDLGKNARRQPKDYRIRFMRLSSWI